MTSAASRPSPNDSDSEKESQKMVGNCAATGGLLAFCLFYQRCPGLQVNTVRSMGQLE
jgi:hypothetical protein